MKKIALVVLVVLASPYIFGQTASPEKWTFTKQLNNDGSITLIFNVKLEKDWHIYSQYTDEGGPLPMVFKFNESPCYSRIDKVKEPAPHVEYDSLFMVTVRTFDKEASFEQKVKINSPTCKIFGTIEYQICKEACIFKEAPFSFSIADDTTK